jgi:hypothetical protein
MFGLKKLERRAKAMILLALTGGVGAGGYFYSDHPIVRQLLGKVRKEVEQPDDRTAEIEHKVKDKAKTVLQTLVGDAKKRVDPNTVPGTYEVTISEVRIDSREFHIAPLSELEVRVTRHGARVGDDKVVWQGTAKATRSKDEAGDPTLTASWADHPFQVEWHTGDEFTVEISDRHALGLIDPKWFSLDLDDDGSFPLRTQTHRLTTRADGKPSRDPSANSLVLRSQRADTPAVAEDRPEGRAIRR